MITAADELVVNTTDKSINLVSIRLSLTYIVICVAIAERECRHLFGTQRAIVAIKKYFIWLLDRVGLVLGKTAKRMQIKSRKYL